MRYDVMCSGVCDWGYAIGVMILWLCDWWYVIGGGMVSGLCDVG